MVACFSKTSLLLHGMREAVRIVGLSGRGLKEKKKTFESMGMKCVDASEAKIVPLHGVDQRPRRQKKNQKRSILALADGKLSKEWRRPHISRCPISMTRCWGRQRGSK